ncbi:L-threonine 3-dehydrogenase [Streptomyces sp. NPDC000927]|uniref:L-threonine 3-dehydrogenase n=1 Tax=Streptomyces sp. NPDC000927 TaxID=3154371 RepID=UPI003328B1D7
MKALIKSAPSKGLNLVELPIPTPGRDDVLIRVLRTGICETDIHLYQWDEWASRTVRTPRVIGHEFVGEIVEIGPGVGGLSPGDIVSAEGNFACGGCTPCRSGRQHLCPKAESLGIDRDGAFVEYMMLPSSSIWVHSDDTALDVAAIFDAFGSAVHAVDTFPVKGRSVLVTGAGPLGIMAAAIAMHLGAEPVVITDISSYRLDLAREAGVKHALEAESPLMEEAGQLDLAGGFDVGLEMSGSRNALRGQISGLARGGQLAVLGLPRYDIPTDWSRISLRMLTIQGVSGRQVFDTWHRMRDLMAEGFDPSPVITHHFPAEEYEKAFRTASEGKAGKVILTWGEKS